MPNLSVSLFNTPDVPTHYPHNTALATTVIDLVWISDTLLQSPSTSLVVDAVGHDGSDHAKLLITLPLSPEFNLIPRIKHKSDEEAAFLVDACRAFPPADNIPLDDHDSIQILCDMIFDSLRCSFVRCATTPKITARSKRWWNDECHDVLQAFCDDRSQDNQCAYFCTQFFSATNHPIDFTVLDNLECLPSRLFNPISMVEIEEQVALCASCSAAGPDHITWPVVKFKASTTVVIPKPKKTDYTVLKAYCPIVLLSCLGKLCEKVIANRLQFEALKHSIFHLSQCGGVKAHCTEDAGVLLAHHILAACKHGLHTLCLAVDIAQFYPSVLHELLARVLEHQGFAPEYVVFFCAYLTDRITQFRWNNNLSDLCPANVGVGQGSALSPVLANLCITPILHVFSISIPRPRVTTETASMLFYVDDGVLVYFSDSMGQNVLMLKHLFSLLRTLFLRLGFVLKPDKLELMHFSRCGFDGVLPPLILPSTPPAIPVSLKLLMIWHYLGFFFDHQLNFHFHVNFYATHALSTVHSYPLLGNSNRGLTPSQKCQLYLSCVLPLLTYGVCVWYDPRKCQVSLLKPVRRAQAAAARWITGSFHTSPIGGMEVLAGLLPVHLHLKKLYLCSHLCIPCLPSSHVLLRSLPSGANLPPLPPMSFTYSPVLWHIPAQSSLPLHFIVQDLPEHLEDSLPLHIECHPGQHLIDTFSSSIHYDISHPKKASNEFPLWLDQFCFSLSLVSQSLDSVFAFSDGSVLPSQGNRAAASFCTFRGQQELFRRSISCGQSMLYDAELFGLYMAIRHLTQVDANSIHLYCDNESTLRMLFDTRLHASQMLSIMACCSARSWLLDHPECSIHLHWCPGHVGIENNEQVDRDANTAATSLPITPYISHAYACQHVTHNITKEWQRLAHLLSHIRHQFIPNARLRRVSHINGGPFMNAFSDNSAFAARMARTILNHAPTGEFRSRFFPYECANCNWCP
ncbi:hypothetical protein EWM64_g2600 [Hericium alpestre]|uniref:Reverse transcriptase domain-containing protein n=1 Tax=Hericium alpestre TaxID=135208 RepID=A0A4Z0A595_9AGAM|nr:hypothetical protein EWM64_g2600 [Hericium alpestre]